MQINYSMARLMTASTEISLSQWRQSCQNTYCFKRETDKFFTQQSKLAQYVSIPETKDKALYIWQKEK